MKVAIFLTLLVAGITAEPVKFVDTPVPQYQRGAIEILLDLFDTIRSFLERNDPAAVDFFLAETVLLDRVAVGISVEGFYLQGHSHFQINEARYENGVLSLDASLPEVALDLTMLRAFAGSAALEIGGNLNLRNLGLELVLGFDNSGDSAQLRDLDLALKRPNLSSNLFVRALGNDYSDRINHLINNRLSDWVDENGHRITDLIVRLVWRIVNSVRERP